AEWLSGDRPGGGWSPRSRRPQGDRSRARVLREVGSAPAPAFAHTYDTRGSGGRSSPREPGPSFRIYRATAGHCGPAVLPKAAGEVAHRALVCERDDGSFCARLEHRPDVLRRDPRDHAKLRVLLLHTPHVLRIRPARRMPRIPKLERAPDRALRAAANPNLRLR